MSETALMVRDDSKLALLINTHALSLREDALAESALIGKVNTPEHNEQATAAIQTIHTLASKAEAERKTIKAPILDYGRNIDDTVKSFVAPLLKEKTRVGKLQGDYLALEEARVRSANAARDAEAKAIEREREAKLAAAKSHDERDKIQEEASNKAREMAEAKPVEVPRVAKGQSVRKDWEIDVVDIHALYRAHPNCVRLEAMRSEIRKLLDMGITPTGVRAKEVITSGVRATKERKEIEV
jgi:hypothetical protein